MAEKTGQSEALNSQEKTPAEGQNPDKSGGTDTQKKKDEVNLTEFYRGAYNEGMAALMKRVGCKDETEMQATLAAGREAAKTQGQAQEQAKTVESLSQQLKQLNEEHQKLLEGHKALETESQNLKVRDALEPIFAKAAKPRLAMLDYFDQHEARLEKDGRVVAYSKTGAPIFGSDAKPMEAARHAAAWLNEHQEHLAAANTSGSGAGGGAGGTKTEAGNWNSLTSKAKELFGGKF